MYKLFLKRLIDIVFSIFFFVLLSPVFIITVILLAIYNHGPVFFFQYRPGKSGKTFNLIKFKTMRDSYDIGGKPLSDYQRITYIGNLVRKTSLDELPQLLNVIKGDMSLVGPRPLLVKYLPLYNEEQRKRHQVRPGITGWAQVNGRNSISWAKKFEYDVYYVNNYSFLLDFKILLLTVKKVFVREGINMSQNKTMEAFNGRN